MCIDCDPTEFADVRRFHRKFGLVERRVPVLPDDFYPGYAQADGRADFLREELNEFEEAAEQRDLPGMADALVDLVYVALGTAVILGLPWRELWADVQRANMAKSRAVGMGKDDHHGSIYKPEGWVGPRTLDILTRFGYDRDGDPTTSWPPAPQEDE